MKMDRLHIVLLLMCLPLACAVPAPQQDKSSAPGIVIKLPEPLIRGEVSLEEAIYSRRSIRQYTGFPLTLSEVSQLLWSAQGITAGWGGRTVPSAGGLNPLEAYLVAGNVEGLKPGLYRYMPQTNDLLQVGDKDLRTDLAGAALNQSCVRDGAVSIVISGVHARTTVRYGDRGVRYVHMEAGHASQNIYLQATALGLGTVAVGAFDDKRVTVILGLPADEVPLYIMPVGRQ